MRAERLLFVELMARADGAIANANELNALAMAYDTGRGCNQCTIQAVTYLVRAADKGHEIAAATLAHVTNDMRWWLRAAHLGNEGALSYLASINNQ